MDASTINELIMRHPVSERLAVVEESNSASFEIGLVDLVIPVLNEAHVLASSVNRLRDFAADHCDFNWRIIIADNGSQDGTIDVCRDLSRRFEEVEFVHLEKKGRGRALRHVWSTSHAEYSLYMDVDLSTDLEALPRAVALLMNGADVVTGSRLHREARIVRCLKREVLSRGFNYLIRLILGTQSFDDAQCGFKGVRLASVRPLLPLIENQNWFFDTELLVLAEYAGLRVESIPIRWIEDPDSRVKIIATVIEDLRSLARLRRSAWRDTAMFRELAKVAPSRRG
jgi:glycosyltransferase involved in cell wall biosynthesis